LLEHHAEPFATHTCVNCSPPTGTRTRFTRRRWPVSGLFQNRIDAHAAVADALADECGVRERAARCSGER